PIFTLIGANALDRLGIWVRTGDVTGDGIADLIVGADQEDLDGETNRGAAYLVRGGPHLVDGVADLSSLGTADFTLTGHLARITPPSGAAGYHFGATCQIADLDGNGRGEILAAAALFRGGAGLPAAGAPPDSAEDIGGSERGTVYIVWDDAIPTGAWPTEFTLDASSPSNLRSVLHGASSNLYFGEELLGGRDYDNDGQADLFVGDLTGDGSVEGDQDLAGLGWVFWNAASLKGRTLDLTSPPDDLRLTAILGPQPGALGSDTSAHGDFDGDGVDDLVIASPHASPAGRESAGSAHVLFGKEGGWPEVIDTRQGRLPSTDAVRITEIYGAAGTSGSDLGDTLGYSAAAADIDGDGRTDLLINEMVGNGLVPGTIDVGNLVLISGSALADATTPPVPAGACSDSAGVLCVGDQRFQLEVTWKDFDSRTGIGRVAEKAADSGLFWFFSESNWELLVKVLDGCSFNDHFWVFSAATTNVEYTLKVTDTRTGAVRQYVNNLGVSAPAVTDTE
ncbi:MAG: integrin alpha, partial [Acidobacteriota bacterium]